jgi:26S proteasome regulatory subunit N1
MLMTFDEELRPLATPVRVGQAVDTVGQAGKPKTITGFQTHNTPVLLAAGERAELATDDCKIEFFFLIISFYLSFNITLTLFFLFSDIPVSNILEGFVILRKNPNASSKN